MSRSVASYRGWDKRRERDERVEGNLSPDLVPLWRKVKRGLRCTTSHDCYEAMMQYAHEHPGEAVVAMAEDAERDLEKLLAAERRAIRDEGMGLKRGSLAFPPKPRKYEKSNRGGPMARSRSRSRALARRSVSVKPVVIRTTKVVKAKKHHHRRGGLGIGGFLGGGNTEMMMAGAALGFLDKSAMVASLPKLPFLGEHGTIAIAAYMFSGGGRNKLAANICRGALFLSAYELVKQGSISGDDAFPM
jgi:hypothetical protein